MRSDDYYVGLVNEAVSRHQERVSRAVSELVKRSARFGGGRFVFNPEPVRRYSEFSEEEVYDEVGRLVAKGFSNLANDGAYLRSAVARMAELGGFVGCPVVSDFLFNARKNLLRRLEGMESVGS